MFISEVDYQDILNIRQQVMYPHKDIDFVKLSDDDKALHIGVFENNTLMSAMSIFIEERDVQFRKLATRIDMQNKGYGSALMKWLIDYAMDMKLERLWCNARVEAAAFYSRFGYKKTEKYFSKDGVDYVIMEKTFVHST